MQDKKEGYVIICLNSLNQSKVYAKLEDIKLNPDDPNSRTLKDEFDAKDKKITNLENKVNALEKKVEMGLEAISVLLEQTKLNLTQQQLLILKNIGGKKNV